MARAALNAIMNFFKRQVNMARIYSARCCFTLALIFAVVSVGVSGFGSEGLSISSHSRALDVAPVALLSVGGSPNPEQPGGRFMSPDEGPLQLSQSSRGPDSSETPLGDIRLNDEEFSPTEGSTGAAAEENRGAATPRNHFEEDKVHLPPQDSPQQYQGGSSEDTYVKSFLSEMELEISRTNHAALEQPAAYCAGEGDETSFCTVVREFAASLTTSADLECIPRKGPVASSQPKNLTSKKFKGLPLMWPGRKGLGGKTSSSSMLQIPSQKEIDARVEAAAREYNERVRQAASQAQPRLEAAGTSGSSEALSAAVGTYYRTYAILHSAYYLQAGTYILTTSAKILLENLKTTLVGTENQVLVSKSELYSALLSSLPGSLSSAWHFMDFVMSFIDAALDRISNNRSGGERYVTEAFIKLNDLDALVSHTARRKSDLSFTVDRPVNEIDTMIKADLDPTISGSLEADVQLQIVEKALDVINRNAEASSQVTSSIVRGPETAPAFPPRFGGPGAEAPREVLIGAPPQAPRWEAMPREGEGAVGPPAPGAPTKEMAKAEAVARQREKDSITEIGRNLAHGAAQFHSVSAEYVMGLQGTSSAACQTDVSLAAPTEEEKKSGVLPRSCAARAARAVESLVTRPLAKVDLPPVRLFATQFDIEKYVKELWQVEKTKIMDESSPAPSFYTLVSTGCISTSGDLTRQFWQAWRDRDLFRNVAANPIQNERLRRRVEILTRNGILPFMTKDHDKRVGGSLNSQVANFLHEQRLKGEKMQKSSREPARVFGFLNVCDHKCYLKTDSRRGDVLASFMFAADHTLMVLESMLKRAVGYALSFMQGDDREGQPQPSQGSEIDMSRKEARNNSLELFRSYKKLRKGKKDPSDSSTVLGMLKHLQVNSQFTNILAADRSTKNLMGLLIHSWVQARGLHAAAEGFKPGSSSKAPVKSTNLAAIFAKLWFDSTQMSGAEEHKLKPFGSAVVSAGLQIAFFLHTVAEGYEASLLKQMGAAIKSFFASIFKGSASASLPASWAVLQMRAMRQHKVRARQYEGVLIVISQLSKMFKERFLESMYTSIQPEALKAVYTVIQALVGLWMTPLNESFDLASSNISSAKKLFYYHTFFHPKGPSFFAARLIKEECSASGNTISFGVVVDVKDSNRKSVNGSDFFLKKKPLKLKSEKALIASLNKVMATYTDPITIVYAAMDLTIRCNGRLRNPTGREQTSSASPFASSSTISSSNPQQTEEPPLQSAESAGASFEQLGDAFSKQKGGKAKRDPWAEDQVLASKLVVDSWCQIYKENLLTKMAGFELSKSSWDIQRQLDDILESITEISVSIKKGAQDRIISFKCLWMSGHHNQEAMKAERNAMMAYAISSSSVQKRLARQLKGVKKSFETVLRSIVRTQMTRPATSRYGLMHVGTEAWTGNYFMWPEAA